MYVVTPNNVRQSAKKAPEPLRPVQKRPVAAPAPFEVKKKPLPKPATFGERKGAEKPSKPSVFGQKFTAGKVMLITLLLGAAGLMYLMHIFTMQQMLRDITRMTKDYERARLRYEDRMLTWERKTGPAEIYLKAKANGLEYGGLTDQTLVVEKN